MWSSAPGGPKEGGEHNAPAPAEGTTGQRPRKAMRPQTSQMGSCPLRWSPSQAKCLPAAQLPGPGPYSVSTTRVTSPPWELSYLLL